MQAGKDIVEIPIGATFKATYDFLDENSNTEDFEGRTATVKLKNIFKDANDGSTFECIDCVEVEPLDSESNKIKGRILLNIKSAYTSKFEIPSSEIDPYIESAIYGIIQVIFDNGEVPLIISVKPLKTL
jgi:hypothetical protein